MSNHYHPKRITPASGPLRGILFRARRKDNQQVAGVKERCESFLTRKRPYELRNRFARFVAQGQPGEVSRFYISVNARDNAKTRTALMHLLIDADDVDMATLDQMAVSVAMQPEQRAERHWLLDVDDPSRIRVEALRRRIHRIYEESDAPGGVTVIPTINGYHLICSHGFDARQLGDMQEWADIKKDALYLHAWETNPADKER